MPEMAETSEIVTSAVNLLHEGRLGIYDALRFKDAMDLIDDLVWISYVFEDCLNYYTVKGIVPERNVVTVDNYTNPGGKCDIRVDKLDSTVLRQGIQALAQRTAAKDQDPRAGRTFKHKMSEIREILLRFQVGANAGPEVP